MMDRMKKRDLARDSELQQLQSQTSSTTAPPLPTHSEPRPSPSTPPTGNLAALPPYPRLPNNPTPPIDRSLLTQLVSDAVAFTLAQLKLGPPIDSPLRKHLRQDSVSDHNMDTTDNTHELLTQRPASPSSSLPPGCRVPSDQSSQIVGHDADKGEL